MRCPLRSLRLYFEGWGQGWFELNASRPFFIDPATRPNQITPAPNPDGFSLEMGQCFPSKRPRQPGSSGDKAAQNHPATRAAAVDDAGVRGGGGGDEPRSQSERVGRAAITEAGKGCSKTLKSDPYSDEEGWDRSGVDETPEMADVGPNMVV